MEEKKGLKRLTDGQMEALRDCIKNSPDATEFAKRALLWLLDQTENMTIPVKLSFWPRGSQSGWEVTMAAHNICSDGCKTQFYKLMDRLGAQLYLCNLNEGACFFTSYVGYKDECFQEQNLYIVDATNLPLRKGYVLEELRGQMLSFEDLQSQLPSLD